MKKYYDYSNIRNCKYLLEIKSIRPLMTTNKILDYCGICRNTLSENNCKICINDLEFYENEGIFENVFDPLELRTKDNNKSLFDSLPKDLLFYIVDRIPKKGLLYTNCPIVLGECGHLYHNHCINTWRKKKDICPLCNRIWIPKRMDTYINYKLIPK